MQFPELFVPPNSFSYRGSYILQVKGGWGIAELLGLLMSLVVPDHECGREVLGRVSLRASFGRFLVVSDRGCGWKVSRRMLLGL